MANAIIKKVESRDENLFMTASRQSDQVASESNNSLVIEEWQDLPAS